jgi:hypothetical protein
MGTAILTIIGILLVIGIIYLILKVAMGALVGVGGIAYVAVMLIRCFPILSIALVGAIVYSEDVIAPVLLYAVAVVLLTRRRAAKDIKEQAFKKLAEQGIVSEHLALGLEPSENTPIYIFAKALQPKGYGKKVLDKAAAKHRIGTKTCDGARYYFDEGEWEKLASRVANEVIATLNNQMQKYGIISENMSFNIDNKYSDLRGLIDVHIKDSFAHYVQRIMDERDVISETIPAARNSMAVVEAQIRRIQSLREFMLVKNREREGVKLFIDKTVLTEKKNYLQGRAVIEEKDVDKLFGERDLAEKEVIMNICSALWKDMDYKLVEHDADHFWIHATAVDKHTCADCKEVYKSVEKYGKNQYCKGCLTKIHEQEDADEAEGKSVRRYISAPPPGVKIEM